MLISIEDLELYLNKTITGTSDENLYDYLITAVQEKVERICNRAFEETDYLEKYDGNGQTELLLNQFPVTSVASVNLVDTDNSIISEIDLDDIVVDKNYGGIYYKGVFPRGKYNILVSYSAGYSNNPSSAEFAVPEDLKMVIMDMIEQTKNKSITNPELKSENLGDYSYEKFGAIEVNDTQVFTLKLYTKYDS